MPCPAEAANTNYDLFGGFIPEGKPKIDGKIGLNEWDEMGHRVLYKFFGEDSKIDIYLMWDATYLYVGAAIEDYELWVDSFKASEPWVSTWDDDAFKLEIDPDYSRHEYLQATDRSFAINADGSAYRFDKGDGSGGLSGAALIDQIIKSVNYHGKLNDYRFHEWKTSAQQDKGFVVEAAISWRNIFGSQSAKAPSDGYSIGLNFTNIEDDTGGALDATYKREWKRVPDEVTRFMGEEEHPENWAEFVISSTSDSTAPSPLAGLKVTRITPFTASISFTASGDNGSAGYARSYEIRYSSSQINEQNWHSATVYKNNFRPQMAGKEEKFKLIGFLPNTRYYIAIKAVDERNNASPLASTTFLTPGAASGDKGFIAIDPGQRYLRWEKGDPFVVIGDNQAITWPKIRAFYNGSMWDDAQKKMVNPYNLQEGRDFLRSISEHGVNTIRIMAEDIRTAHPIYLFSDVSKGPNAISYNQATLDFLSTLLDECAVYGISVIVVPFDTFYYRLNWSKVPFSTSMGGPLSDPSHLCEQSSWDYLKAVLAKLYDEIGDRKNLLAWDLLNEFDSDEPGIGWNRAAFEKKEALISELATYMRSLDQDHLIHVSSVRWDPKFTTHMASSPTSNIMGADPMLVLNNVRYDFNCTHTYYHDIRDPNLNHPNNRTAPDGSFTYQLGVTDLDNTIAPAPRIKHGLQFYYANALTPKPYFNTEWGPIVFYVSDYDQYFSETDDYQYYHNASWGFLSNGDVGSGLRWPGDVLFDRVLPDQMRKYQLAMHNFIASNLKFSNFTPTQIGQCMRVLGTEIPVIKGGITYGKQGIIFLVKDERKGQHGNVSKATLMVPSLDPLKDFRFEFWDSSDETKKSPISSATVSSDVFGRTTLDIPTFSLTQAIKFYQLESTTVAEGVVAVDNIWIKAVLKPTWTGNVTLRWRKGGEDVSPAGDKSVWGYLYAGPKDFPYGSLSNPEVFVKIYIASNGWKNIAFNHVTVDKVDVFSALDYNGQHDQKGEISLDNRVVAHSYDPVGNPTPSTSAGSLFSGWACYPSVEFFPIRDSGYGATKDLWIKAVLKPAWTSHVTLRWQKGGEDVSPAGATTVWGYLYADPADFPYGSESNPEVFVKIYKAENGWQNIAFNHVTVDDVDVFSALSYDGKVDQQGTISIKNRIAPHPYDPI